jgi:hypothetical protein
VPAQAFLPSHGHRESAGPQQSPDPQIGPICVRPGPSQRPPLRLSGTPNDSLWSARAHKGSGNVGGSGCGLRRAGYSGRRGALQRPVSGGKIANFWVRVRSPGPLQMCRARVAVHVGGVGSPGARFWTCFPTRSGILILQYPETSSSDIEVSTSASHSNLLGALLRIWFGRTNQLQIVIHYCRMRL